MCCHADFMRRGLCIAEIASILFLLMSVRSCVHKICDGLIAFPLQLLRAYWYNALFLLEVWQLMWFWHYLACML